MEGDQMLTISQEERERAVLRSRRMYQTDLQSNLATAEDRGRREGRREMSIEIAKRMMTMGLPHDEIMEATGLTSEDLDNISMP